MIGIRTHKMELMANEVISVDNIIINGDKIVSLHNLYRIGHKLYAGDINGNHYEIKKLGSSNIIALYKPKVMPTREPEEVLYIQEYFDYTQSII